MALKKGIKDLIAEAEKKSKGITAEAAKTRLGDPDTVTAQLRRFYDEAGGFGTLMMVTGKDWATREKRTRSMKLFMEQVAPKLRDLEPATA